MDWLSGWQAWMAAGFLLLTAEMFVPGVFMVWFGLAALLTGIAVWLMPGLAWPLQAVLFAVLSGVMVVLYWRLRGKYDTEASDQPMLNRRGEQLIGQVYALHTPIENGRGKLKVGDAFWSARGADLPSGTRVRVVSVKDLVLDVEAVPPLSDA